MIAYDDFLRVDVRAGTVLAAEPLAGARKPAYVLRIDFGPELGERRSSAQITGRYAADELVGTQVCAVVNFPPKRIAGVRKPGARARHGRRGRQRDPRAPDVSRAERPAAVLMIATTGELEIRPLERSGEDPALIAALARLMADAYPIMGITTRDALAAYASSRYRS